MTNAEQFVGSWRLVSYETESSDGSGARPFGDVPNGLIVLDRSGVFSVQIEPPEAAESGDGPQYVAFFGTWSLDGDAAELVLVPRGTVNERLRGTTQRRKFAFEEPRLRLYPPPVQVNGATVMTTVTWERV